jgi:uracil-DNA glycosylase
MNSYPLCPFELGPSWQRALQNELSKPYLLQLAAFVARERAANVVYPSKEMVFNAFRKTPYEQVKVVIVGQDPYHGPNQAHGLSFSVPNAVLPPPSLQNIFKELHDDLGIEIPSHGCLTSWAEQGVMLLNATLTVRQGQPMSHHGKGWEVFTDAVIASLNERKEPLVFMLWGKSAQEKCRHVIGIRHTRHLVLTTTHPSPFSARHGFFGCRHFSKANEWLKKQGQSPINWDSILFSYQINDKDDITVRTMIEEKES